MVEDDSECVFNIAREATEKFKGLQVVILKRFPRYDNKADDPLQCKKKLSNYANGIYDHMWVKNGSPNNIHVVNVEIGSDSSTHIKNLVYGHTYSNNYDGISLNGEGASRHLSYRTVQAIKPIIMQSKQVSVQDVDQNYDDQVRYSIPFILG